MTTHTQRITSSATAISNNNSEQQEVTRIKRENQNIFHNLSVLESEERIVVKNKSEQILHLAKNYERLAELGDYTRPLDHICADICWELEHNRKLSASASLARAILPAKYKQTQFIAYSHPSSSTQQTPEIPSFEAPTTIQQQQQQQPEQQEQELEQSEPLLLPTTDYLAHFGDALAPTAPPEPHKPTDMMDDNELRDYTESMIQKEKEIREALLETRRRTREAKEKCDLKKIPLSPEYEQSREPQISAQSADSGPSEAWEACLEFRATIDKLADKLYRWRPNKQLAHDLKIAFDEEIDFYKPFVDEKYRKCQPSWWVTQLHNIWHGKHAAAIMNSTPIDEKTKRSLTREQVGDKYEEDLKRALRFVAAQKVKVKLWHWFVEYNEKGIARRAKELNATLSEKSFT